MLTTVAVWAISFAVGVVMQRVARRPQRLSHVLFLVALWVMVPLVTFFAYTTVNLGGGLVYALPVVIVASWATLGLGLLWARLGTDAPRKRGLVAIATGLGNTANVGYPIATLVFGSQGLALAVIYSEFQFLIPTIAVAMGIARHYAGPESSAAPAPGLRAVVRSWLVNPPVAAGLVALALRLAGAGLQDVVAPIGSYVGVAFGVLGFVQLGVAVPLVRFKHDAADLKLAAGTLALRCGAAPLVLFAVGAATGVSVPPVYLLLAAMPVALNSLIIARVFHLDTHLARLVIVVSTPLVIGAVLVWQAF